MSSEQEQSKGGAEAADMAKKGATGLAGLSVGCSKGYVYIGAARVSFLSCLYGFSWLSMHIVLSCCRFVGTAEKTTTGMFKGTKDGADKGGS